MTGAVNGNGGRNGGVALLSACASTAAFVLAFIAFIGTLYVGPIAVTVSEHDKLIRDLIANKAANEQRLKDIEEEQHKSYVERKELISNTMSRTEITNVVDNQEKKIVEINNKLGNAYNFGEKLKELDQRFDKYLPLLWRNEKSSAPSKTIEGE